MARASTRVKRMHRLLADHQRIERIAVVAERPGDEAVVGGIVHGAVQHPIQTQQSGLLVQLVLVLAAFRHFDDDREHRFDDRVVHVAVMPGMHPLKVARAGGRRGTRLTSLRTDGRGLPSQRNS